MLEPGNLDKINTSFYPGEILLGMKMKTQPPHGFPLTTGREYNVQSLEHSLLLAKYNFLKLP